MTAFTYEYTVADTPDSEHDRQVLQDRVAQGKGSNETLVKDLKRSFKLEGYVVDRRNDAQVNFAIQEFQQGLDPFQKALMNESQGLLKPSAELIGAGLLKPNPEVLLYKPLSDGKFPIPTKDQIFIRKDPKDPKKIQYIYLDPVANDVRGNTIDMDMGDEVLTQNKIEESKKILLEKIDEESKKPNNENGVKTHYSDNIIILGPEMTHNTFAKTQNESVTLSSVNLVYGYRNIDNNTFFYKPVGQPVQEVSMLTHQNFFVELEKEIIKFKNKFSSDGKITPLVVSYEGQDGVMQEVNIDPLLIIQTNATLNKGDPKPDIKMKITTYDADSHILINEPKFNDQSKIYFDKVKQLDQMINEAKKTQDSIQKWTNRLGSFLGKLIGRQDKLDKSMAGIEEVLTDDFVGRITDKNVFVKLYQLPLSSDKQSALELADFVLRDPPYPPLKAPENQPQKNQVEVIAQAPQIEPEPLAPGERKGSINKP